MERDIAHLLQSWLASAKRKPLVLRGARQVGKTWLVRDLAARSRRQLIEINLERTPGLARHFESNEPKQILSELSLALDCDITPENSLLFLDEIQAASHLLAKLRWFAEEMPQLPVVGAGSLLEFTLANHAFSMPVGRIRFLHVEPMGFHEYLLAHRQNRLLDALSAWRPEDDISDATHEKATLWFHRYAMVGGMPDAVAEDVEHGDPRAVQTIQRDLVATYRADFARYAGRMNSNILDNVIDAVAHSVGRKFVYAQVGSGVKQHQAKQALELLTKARLCHLVRYSAANGLPLSGEAKETFRKAILLDVGLLHALLGTRGADAFPAWADLAPQVRGMLAEQLAGQQLRLVGDPRGDGPELFYWQREGGRPGEIDYLMELRGRIVPIELKAGAAGSMKSLHQFMFEKRLDFAIRIDSNRPSEQTIAVTTTQGDPVKYRLLNIPMYMTWMIGRA